MTTPTALHHLADIVRPDCPIESVSQPEPPLATYNVVGTYADEEDARTAVLALEELETDNVSIGLVNFGEPTADGRSAADERIASTTLARAGRGAIVGAIAGALLFNLAAVVISSGAVVVGAALGGALFGAFIGGLWAAFLRFGGSSAYRQSFSADDTAPTLVTLHTDDPTEASAAVALLRERTGATPSVVSRQHDHLELIEV